MTKRVRSSMSLDIITIKTKKWNLCFFCLLLNVAVVTCQLCCGPDVLFV